MIAPGVHRPAWRPLRRSTRRTPLRWASGPRRRAALPRPRAVRRAAPPGGPPSQPPPGPLPSVPAGAFAHLTGADVAWLAASFDWLRRHAPRLGVHAKDAADLAQQAVIVAAESWGAFVPAPELPPNVARRRWIWGILANRAIGHLRRLRREVLADDARPGVEVALVHQGAEHAPDVGPASSPASAAEARSVLRTLQAATTPDRWRAWFAHHVDGAPVREVARAEGAPVATIYNRLRAARADFLAALAREDAAADGPAVDRTPGASSPRRKG